MAPRVVVVALGGSILAPDGPDLAYAARFADLVGERLAQGDWVLIVTGGGRPARRYIQAGRAASVPEDDLDRIGIAATRLNAQFMMELLRSRLGRTVSHRLHTDVDATAGELWNHRVAVMGGTVPGHSTDLVAAKLASAARADHLYVLTNVDGVYTADPRLDPQAQRLPELTSARLVEIAGEGWHAGRTGVVDPSCAKHIHAAKLRLTVLDGRDLSAVRGAFAGRAGVGSLVTPGGA